MNAWPANGFFYVQESAKNDTKCFTDVQFTLNALVASHRNGDVNGTK